MKREKVRELQLRAAGILVAGGLVFLQAGPGLPGVGQTIYAEESAEDEAGNEAGDNTGDGTESITREYITDDAGNPKVDGVFAWNFDAWEFSRFRTGCDYRGSACDVVCI